MQKCICPILPDRGSTKMFYFSAQIFILQDCNLCLLFLNLRTMPAVKGHTIDSSFSQRSKKRSRSSALEKARLAKAAKHALSSPQPWSTPQPNQPQTGSSPQPNQSQLESTPQSNQPQLESMPQLNQPQLVYTTTPPTAAWVYATAEPAAAWIVCISSQAALFF